MRILEEPHLRELLFQADPDIPLSDKLGSLLGECLAAEGTLCLPGLGTFRMTNGRLCFEPWTRKRVFLAYVKEDIARVKSLYRYLKRQGFDPWMDVYRLLPGQDWPRAIERAISMADFVVPCFSRTSCTRRSHFNRELRYALECAEHVPLEATYLVPIRLEPCKVPVSVQRQIQYLDLFPDFDAGLRKLLTTLVASNL
jgi:hypothetical protein